MEINARLRHVRWIGGGSGAGKSAVAERLAVAHRLRIYHTEPSAKYSSRLRPEDAPLLHAFAEMDMDERWVNRPAQVMYETFHGFDGETFHLIVEDLLDLGDEAPVLAEGFVLLPRLVAPLLAISTKRYGFFRLQSSAVPRSIIAARPGQSPTRRATPTGHSPTSWPATGCSPRICAGRRPPSTCLPSKWTAALAWTSLSSA
jgi:hypothetical protein